MWGGSTCAKSVSQMVSPSPLPVLIDEPYSSPLSKGLRTFARVAGDMPVPVSATLKTTQTVLGPGAVEGAPSQRMSTDTVPPVGVYWTPLLTRLS